MRFSEDRFRCMGSDVRLLVGAPARPGLPSSEEAVADARAWLEVFDARLSRFRSDSELCALNADSRRVVPAGALLRSAVAAGVWAARRTGGLVDPTLLPALEAAGYRTSRDGVVGAPVGPALAAAPPRSPARPHRDARWRDVKVDDAAGTITRPVGVALDSGGIGKGLAADALAHRLAGYARFAVDCGGDVRVGGADPQAPAVDIEIAHPLDGSVVRSLALRGGAIATSGIDVRIWRRDDGTYAHHLIDPGTGEPAWTGLVGATALAPTALEAETLAKAALLSGRDAGRELLAPFGGVLVADDGAAEIVGALVQHRDIETLVLSQSRRNG